MARQVLDNSKILKAIDSQNMLSCVEDFSAHWRDAADRAKKFRLPKIERPDNIVICGMGGSAIGGDILRSYLQLETKIPIEVVRNYRLPGYVGKNSLVIASSYSGNTEESLAAFTEARRRQAQRFALSTGGNLTAICKRDRVACFPLVPGFQPRAALAHGFVPLLVFFDRWRFTAKQSAAIKETADILDKCIQQYRFASKTGRNPAKKIAQKLLHQLPVIYGAQDHMQPVAQRWQAQINENAKTLAHTNVLPEMNHNEILGWDAPDEIVTRCHLLFLQDEDDHPQTARRFSIMAPILKKKVDGITKVNSKGKGLLARMFSLIILGDFISVYLALLQDHDPTPIPAINTLKQKLAK